MDSEVEKYISDHEEEFVEDLKRLIAQPSVSASGEGIEECTQLLEELCDRYGFNETHILESEGHPYVVSRAFVDDNPDNSFPTILIYGHYDTQPVNRDEWENPPFEPTVVEGPDGLPRIHARGAGDNKGNHFAHICAVRAYRETIGLPMNVTLFLDGEEEIGSPNIEAVVEQHADLLEADIHFGADGSIHESGRPVVKLGSRGILPIRITAKGANSSLHSGHWGGSVPSPVWEIVNILGSMKDEDGRITIEGFYDDVREITAEDREVLEEIPVSDEDVMQNLDIEGLAAGPGNSHLEKNLYYPTLNISGLSAGYTGDGFQNSVPNEARAQVDIRLVMDQTPDDIYEKFVNHVEERSTGLVDVEVERHASRSPDRAPLDTPLLEAVTTALEDVWGEKPIVYPTTGASGPSDVFFNLLGLPRVGVGYANSDEQQHTPNETMALHCFMNGIKSTAVVLENGRHVVAEST